MRHDWKITVWKPGQNEQVCGRCGATRSDFSIGSRGSGWSPAELNGKRQPFCPKEVKGVVPKGHLPKTETDTTKPNVLEYQQDVFSSVGDRKID